MKKIGLGSEKANILVYIQNRPPLHPYQTLTSLKALNTGDIAEISHQTGNHWRKIFNVFAKLIHEFEPSHYSTWQLLRDQHLLQANSNQCLLFSSPEQDRFNGQDIHIILGKGYAQQLQLTAQCHWLSPDFAINSRHKIIISPYFDYRQLSNIKIKQLARLIEQMRSD